MPMPALPESLLLPAPLRRRLDAAVAQLYQPELLDWVQATAAFGFLEAHCAFVRPLSDAQRDRFYAEGQPAARLYGARGAPSSQAELDALFARMQPRLEASPIVHEFLRIVAEMPAAPLRPAAAWLIRAT